MRADMTFFFPIFGNPVFETDIGTTDIRSYISNRQLRILKLTNVIQYLKHVKR